MSGSNSANYELLDRLADEFAARYRNGERPALTEYVDRYPELADEIRELFPAMVQIEQAEEDRRDAEAPVVEDVAQPRLQQLGDFRILREVGKGGMGIVFEAEQVSLGRHVALKVLPKKMLLDAKAKRRFEREAKAAAKLHHTNIVPVFGVGEQDGLPYYVMQFIQGLGLDEVLEELKRLQGTPNATTASTPGGALRISRKDLSAANMAQSLLTGEFKGALERASAVPVSVSRPPSDPACTASVTPQEGAAAASAAGLPTPQSGSSGSLSDSFTLSSSSVTLPGQPRHADRPKAKKLTYWQSVAQVGMQVAGALDYAHKQGILHRDVKPSNLLLDMQGTVWVADFGLAKTDDQQDITHTGDILGTLRYMPPEAFEGKTDPRSDVYSLGLTLFEMLAMKPAFQEKDRNRLIKLVTASEAPRLERLNSAVPRDLVTIVHKAMERDPAQRYHSAAELEADLNRFIDDEPIKARPLGLRERAWRWCRHNPGIASLSAALLLILVGISVASALAAAHFDQLATQEAAARVEEQQAKEQEAQLRVEAELAQQRALANLKAADTERRRAEANFAKARTAVDAYFTKVTEDQLLQAPGLEKLRRELLRSALTFYQDFLKERGGDRSLRTDLAATQLRVGRISTDLELEDEALKALQNAIAVYDELLREQPQELAFQEALADAWEALGDLHYLHLAAPMHHAFQMAVKYRESLGRNDPLHLKKLAVTYNRLGIATSSRPEAFECYRKSIEIRQRLLAANPNDPTLHYGMGESFLNLARFLNTGAKGREEALTMYLRAQEFYQFAYTKLPHMVEYGLDLGSAYTWAGGVCAKLGRTEEARAQYAKAIEHGKTMCREHPSVPAAQRFLVTAYVGLTYFEEGVGRNAAARQALLEAAAVMDRQPALNAEEYYRLACLLGRAIMNNPENARQRPEEDRAMEALARAVAAGYRKLDQIKLDADKELAPLAKRADFKQLLANPEAFGRAQQAKDKQRAEARVNLAALDAANRARLDADFAASRQVIGLIQLQLGKFDAAGAALTEVADLRTARLKAEPTNVQYRAELAATLLNLGDAQWQAGRPVDAAATWKKVLDLVRVPDPNAADEPARLAYGSALQTMGDAYANAGLWEEAARYYNECLAFGERGGLPGYQQANFLNKVSRLAAMNHDKTTYARVQAEVLQRMADWKDPYALTRAARVWCFADEQPADAMRTVGWAEKSAVSMPHAWTRHVLALARYRAGQWDEALAAATHSLKTGGWTPYFLNYPVLAMAHHRLGHADLAREWLDKANAEWRRNSPLPRAVTGLRGWPSGLYQAEASWLDWLDFELLLREASVLITGKPPQADAFAVLHRGYWHMKLNEKTKAEAELQTAVDTWPDEPLLWLERGRVFAGLGQADRAAADRAKALQVKATDPAAWIDCGRLLAEQGQHQDADAFFAKAAALTPTDLNAFIQAGWWAVGPYPGDLQLACPPEQAPDPSRTVAALAGAEPLAWQRAQTTSLGYGVLRGATSGEPVSNYALTYLYSPRETTATFLVGGNDRVRVWLNGVLVHETDRPVTDSEALNHVPVTLRAGRNTVLCKISQGQPNAKASFYLIFRSADNRFDRAALHAQLGLWQESAQLYGRAFDRQPTADSSLYVRGVHAHVAAGDTAGARRYLERMFEHYDREDTSASARDQANKAAWLAYAGVLVDGAIKPARLVELAEQGLQVNDVAWKYYVAGIAYYRAGQFDKALERFAATAKDARWKAGKTHHSHAVELGMALAHHGLGHAQQAKELLDRVEQWYEQTLQTTLDSPLGPLSGWTDRPGFLVLRREAHKLINGTDLKEDPRERQLVERMRRWLDQRDPALVDYDMAIMRAPTEPRWYLARARRLTQLKRDTEADADFAKALSLAPDDPHWLRERGRIYTELGRPEQAAADCASARELIPSKDGPALTPEEAAHRIEERCVVEMVVQSAGKGSGAFFLNSKKNYKDDDNFVLFINGKAAFAFKNAKIDDPLRYYEGKTIRVAGRVTLYQDRPEIAVARPEQIQIIEPVPSAKR